MCERYKIMSEEISVNTRYIARWKNRREEKMRGVCIIEVTKFKHYRGERKGKRGKKYEFYRFSI